MEPVPAFQLGILSAADSAGRRAMCIIIRRSYAYLEEVLRRAFEGQEDVRVVVDRRYGERRTRREPGARERRRGDRRQRREEVAEVVVM